MHTEPSDSSASVNLNGHAPRRVPHQQVTPKRDSTAEEAHAFDPTEHLDRARDAVDELSSFDSRNDPDAAVISSSAFGSLDIVVPNFSAPQGADSAELASHVPVTTRPSKSRTFRTALPLAVADLITLGACFLFATALMKLITGWLVGWTFFEQYIAVAVFYTGTSWYLGLLPGSGLSPPFELRQIIGAVSFTFFAQLVVDSVFGHVSRGEAVALLGGGVATIIMMPLVRFGVRNQLCKYKWWGERVVIVGATKQGHAIAHFFSKNTQRGLRPIGLVDEPEQYWNKDVDFGDLKYLGSVNNLQQIAERYKATWAIVAVSDRSPEVVTRVLNRCSMMPHLWLLPSRAAIPSLWNKAQECGGVAGIKIEDRLLRTSAMFVKRTFDIVMSGMALIAFSPVFAFLAVMIKINSPGNVFYGHTRIGRGGKRFKAWKFRSMVQDADRILKEALAADPELAAEWEADQKLRNDPRVIKGVGSFIRKTSIDELPQLWNVFVGEMSLVGPRPIVEDEIARYDNTYPLYLRVRPGITGVWQVSGRNNTTYDSRVSFDNYYVRNWSIWLDIYILFRTVRTIVKREGAY